MSRTTFNNAVVHAALFPSLPKVKICFATNRAYHLSTALSPGRWVAGP
jgi:hypothetical protein